MGSSRDGRTFRLRCSWRFYLNPHDGISDPKVRWLAKIAAGDGPRG
jgi:hypothetical protein